MTQDPDPLRVAYEQRTAELHEARGGLAEAVFTLERELEQRDRELARRGEEASGMLAHIASLTTEIEKHHRQAEWLYSEVSRLSAELRRPWPIRWAEIARRRWRRLGR